MSEMNVWKRDRGYRWWCFGRKLENFLQKVKYSYQRITKGFCDYDTWYLGDYSIELIADMLEHFIKYNHTYPGREPFETPEKWESFLRECMNNLRSALPDEDGRETYQEMLARQELRSNTLRAMLLYWDDLWD